MRISIPVHRNKPRRQGFGINKQRHPLVFSTVHKVIYQQEVFREEKVFYCYINDIFKLIKYHKQVFPRSISIGIVCLLPVTSGMKKTDDRIKSSIRVHLLPALNIWKLKYHLHFGCACHTGRLNPITGGIPFHPRFINRLYKNLRAPF